MKIQRKISLDARSRYPSTLKRFFKFYFEMSNDAACSFVTIANKGVALKVGTNETFGIVSLRFAALNCC
jgi:hypothetical protein